MQHIICHYSEIALKGKNRLFFEKQLVFNIREILPEAQVVRAHGKIIVNSSKEGIEEKLSKVPGVEYFFFAEKTEPVEEKIIEKAIKLIMKESFETFRVTVKRSDKSFPTSSMELAAKIGGEVIKKINKKVNLKNPDLNCFVEIDSKSAYLYFRKIKGLGGLPVKTGGKMVSLLSGGIDSPVASYKMIKRGAKCIFLHFHAYPITSKQSIEKVKRIVKKLSSFQGASVLYLVSFDKIQKEIMTSTEEKGRVLLYRRFMFRIADKIARTEKAKAVITGESLGQVASQTIENIRVAEDATYNIVLRPLIGFNKDEIIKKAEEIGTYNISILPEDDCCVRFLPKNPETRGSILAITKEERKIDAEGLINETLEKVEKIVINPY